MSQLDVHRLRFAFTMLSVNRFPIVLVALVLLTVNSPSRRDHSRW